MAAWPTFSLVTAAPCRPRATCRSKNTESSVTCGRWRSWGTDGTVDWYCPSRFDAPSLFGALLDARKGGYFSLRCRTSARPKQLYLPDTNILLTRFQGA